MWPSVHTLGLVPAENRNVKPMPAELKGLVPAPKDNMITVKPHVPDVVKDTMPLIIEKVKRTRWQTRKLAARLKGPSLEATLRNDSNFILDYIKYQKDDPEHEQIRSPRRLVHEGKGDCDCFAVLLATLLANQGIKFWFRITRYESIADWSHIYIVVPKDQKATTPPVQRSDYYVLDPVTNKHNHEVPFKQKKDFNMSLQYLDGFGMGRLGACETKPVETPATQQAVTADIQNKSVQELKSIRRYALTSDVEAMGLVPTRQFLDDNGFVFTEKTDPTTNSGYFEVDTPAGPVAVPTILRKNQANQLLATDAPTTSAEVLQASTEQPKQAGSGVWGALLLVGAALASMKPVAAAGAAVPGLGGVKKKKIIYI